MADLHGQTFFYLYFFNLIRWIQSCDKKNLTFFDCCDEIFIKLILKKDIKLATGSLNNIFQDLFNKILCQQSTHDRSYMSVVTMCSEGFLSKLRIVCKRVNPFPNDKF